MKKLRVIHCQDPKLWYSHLVGKTVPLLADEGDMFKSLEPAGILTLCGVKML